MSKIIRCKTNPREVEAIKWDGNSVETLKVWGCYVTGHNELYIGELGDEEYVPVGWWIVKDPDATEFWVEPPEKFALWFVPIVEGETNAKSEG